MPKKISNQINRSLVDLKKLKTAKFSEQSSIVTPIVSTFVTTITPLDMTESSRHRLWSYLLSAGVLSYHQSSIFMTVGYVTMGLSNRHKLMGDWSFSNVFFLAGNNKNGRESCSARVLFLPLKRYYNSVVCIRSFNACSADKTSNQKSTEGVEYSEGRKES